MPDMMDLLKRMIMPEGLPQPPNAPRPNLPAPAPTDVVGNGDPMIEPPLGGIPKPPPVHIDDPTGHLTGNFDRLLMQRIVNEAKLEKVDPLTALSMAGQETTFGRGGAGAYNPLHMRDAVTENPLLESLRYFKKRSAQFPNDEELGIQAYNGLGKIQGGREVPAGAPMYGGQIALTGAKDRPYGKRIMELREMLAQQPSIKGLIK